MIFSVTDEIRKSFLQSDQEAFDELFPLEFTVPPDIVALTWESKNSTIFWADSETGSISSATIEVLRLYLHLVLFHSMATAIELASFPQGLQQQVIIDVDVRDVGGMAVDWITHKLYWTDHDLEAIFVSNLDGSHRTTLVSPLVIRGKPTDIVVHPVQGYATCWAFF